MSDDQMWPAQPSDTADDNPSMIAGSLRALQRDVHAGFDRIGRALEGLSRIESRLDVIIDRQNVLERRQDALELRQAATDLAIAALQAANVVRRRKKVK